MKNLNHHLVAVGGCWKVQLPSVNGKQARIATGIPLAEVEKAREERDRLLLPFQIKQKVLAAAVVEKLKQDAGEQLAAAKKAASRVKISEAWNLFPYTETTGRGVNRGLRKMTPKGIETAKSQWGNFVKWAAHKNLEWMENVGDSEATEFSRFMIDGRGVSPATFNKVMNTCGVMFRRSTGSNPFQKVPRRQAQSQSRRPFTPDEIKKIWATLDERIKARKETVVSHKGKTDYSYEVPLDAVEMSKRIEDKKLVALMLYTGMRLGDCATLTVDHVFGGMIHRTTAKDSKNIGFPIVPKLAEILGELPKSGYILPLIGAAYGKEKRETTYTRIARVLDACGFNRTAPRKDGARAVSVLGAHAFRHTFAQLCFDAGVPINEIQRWLGHKSSIVTEIYAHNPAAAMDRIAKAIGAF